MRDMLPPLFQIATGVTFFAVLSVGIFARPVIKWVWGRLIALALVCFAAAFYFLSVATAATSLGAGADMFVAAGATLLAAVLLVSVGLFMAMPLVEGQEPNK